jgi:uncharacterized protein YgiM (DUF1202 family)
MIVKKMRAILPLMVILLYSGGTAQALCVNVSVANVRSGPGMQYDIVWKVYRYMPFKKVGTSISGDWYAVRDVDGEVSWINRTLVRSDVRCAVVKSVRTNVRKGPGIRYRKTSSSPAQQYASFKVLGRRGHWLKVRSEWGETGWIHKSNLWVR